MKRLQRRDFLLLAPAAALGAPWAAHVWQKRDDSGSWIGADGPLVVLQIAAALKWRGAQDVEAESDYDFALRTAQAKQFLARRHGREMLVLDDTGHGAHLETLADGRVALWQKYELLDAEEHTIPVLDLVLNRVPPPAPSRSFSMRVQDAMLRLMAASDGGAGAAYEKRDVAIEPGPKRCDVWELRGGFVLLISPA